MMKKFISKNHGTSMLLSLIGIAMFGIIAIPIVKWSMNMLSYTNMSEVSLGEIGKRKEMQFILRDYWNQLNTCSFDEFEKAIQTKGTTWNEDIDGKYSLNIKFGTDGKYTNAQCLAISANEGDNHCRKVTMTITSKSNNMKETVNTTRIQSKGVEPSRLEDGGGYVKFDNGLIIQYGKVSSAPLDETWNHVDFPIPFETKTAGVSVTISPMSGTGVDGYHPPTNKHYGFVNGNVAPMANNITKTGMDVGADLYGGYLDANYVLGDIYWFAIGY